MAKYRNVYGAETESDNSNRMIWYSVRCTYWTDDWDTLKKVGSGIPCCPKCQSPGFEGDFKQFDDGAKKYDLEHSGYYKLLQKCKNKCYGITMRKMYDKFSELTKGEQEIDKVIKQIIEEFK